MLKLRPSAPGVVSFVSFTLLAALAGCQQPLPPEKAPAPAAGPSDEVPTSPQVETQARAATLAGFSDQVVFSGLNNPIAVRFAPNGKVYVAEEKGRIVVFDSLTDTTFDVVADLSAQVNSYWDRGMLGFTLDPNFASNGFMYVLYAHDTATNAENGQSAANRNGSDNCPDSPGGTGNGCITYGRLSRLKDTGKANYPISARDDLITGWPQQFPSHSTGGLAFGPDGMLYATAGDGASFSKLDYGNFGVPKNPLGDPPAGVGGTMVGNTSHGGSSRSQSLRRPTGEDVVMNGSVIRVDPATGNAAPSNPNINHTDADAKRIVAFGLRNPYRFTFHPTSGDLWIGDVGANAFEEIDRLPAPLTATPIKNFGWPCYEGNGKYASWDGIDNNLCEPLYTAGTAVAPYLAYAHDQPVYSGDACAAGSSAITGLAFYPTTGGNYPAAYKNALFFSDLPRDCIFVMFPDAATGLPKTATRTNFIVAAANPVDLQIGPNNELYYVDYGGDGGTGTQTGTGKIDRVRYQAPVAVATATPTSGFTPLVVQFNGSMSTPGLSGDTLTYAWDLDGDGQFDDSTAKNPAFTYTAPGTAVVRLRVTDQRGGFGDSTPIDIVAGATTSPPAPVIDTPATSLTWQVGDNITFSGHATDVEDGTLPDANLTWEIVMQHCPSACHEHIVQTFTGVASGSFPAPEHEYPSYLQLRLVAADSHGMTTTVTRDLQPQTTTITLQSAPVATPGLDLGLNLEVAASTFTRTVIVGTVNSLSAPNQTRGSNTYTFASWSDGGAKDHDVVATAMPMSFTATYTVVASPWTSQDIGAVGATGSWSESGGTHTIKGGGSDIYGAADAFRFSFQSIQGDATIVARVSSLEAANVWTKAVVMIREDNAPGSKNVATVVSPTAANGYRLQTRATTGGTSTSLKSTANSVVPAWLKLQRAGDVFTSSYSTNGTTFTTIGTATVPMSGSVLVGVGVTSHAGATLAQGVFQSVAITTPAPPVPPAAPTNLVATAGNAQVALSWSAASGATRYSVKRATVLGGPYSDVATGITSTSFTNNTNVANGTTYYYVVSAGNSAGESGNSNEASATPAVPPPPPAPSNVTAAPGNAQVALSWSAVAGASSYTVKRATQTGGPYTAVNSGAATSFTNTGLVNGTTYHYVVSATGAGGEGADSSQVSATPSAPAITWSNQDIGAVAAAGSFSQSGSTFTVKGSGADIWTAADEFQFVFRNIAGNATVTARLATLQNVDATTKAGVMIREGTGANVRNVMMVATPTAANSYRFQYRPTAGATTSKVQAAGTGTTPIWLRLVRNGNVVTGFTSTNGTTFTQVSSYTFTTSLAGTLQVGLALTSHLDGTLATATFDNVTITTP